MWEKKDNLDGSPKPSDPEDADNTYTWSSDGAAANGTAFTDFLWRLNNGILSGGTATSGCFVGHCDWRLPTIFELEGILVAPQPCGTTPCIASTFGPTKPSLYWSATAFDLSPFDAYFVVFSDGAVHFFAKTSSYYVRAVRGGL